MKASVFKSTVNGRVVAPPSKSYTIRALMAAALAPGESFIGRPLGADDTRAAADVLGGVGIRIEKEKDGWRVRGGTLTKAEGPLFCRDSAATLRFMTALAALIPGVTRLTMGPSLAQRPIQPLLDALTRLGVQCKQEGDRVSVLGGTVTKDRVEIPGDISSQYVSALLLLAPRLPNGLTITLTTPPRSRPYLEMTLETLRHFGIHVMAAPELNEFRVAPQDYQPADYQVEGDWSQASYLLALGALAGEVLVTNLNAESLQGDRQILNLLLKFGAHFTLRRASVLVTQSRLHAITADLSDAIDLLPTLAVLAAVAAGQSDFTGIARARLKESNRVAALKEELSKIGIRVIEEEDRLSIIGGFPRGAVLDAHGDHRLAMAFGVLGAAVGRVTVLGAESVSKTYPDYWRVLQQCGVKVVLLVVRNQNADAAPYEALRQTPRPGHADYTAQVKYGGFQDYRGGGRFSGRITAGWVMAGAVAAKLLARLEVDIVAHTTEIGPVAAQAPDLAHLRETAAANPVRCADPVAAQEMVHVVEQARLAGDSLGGIIEVRAMGVPVGWGEPVVDTVEGELAKAYFAIPAVKGVEFGGGFAAALLRGSQDNDAFIMKDGQVATASNNAGGVLGGLTSGMPLVVRLAVKPTPSISQEQRTVNLGTMEETKIKVEGRHDPCIVPRAVVVAEAMTALVLCDFAIQAGALPRILK